MVKRSIANVLGCLTILSIISGCSSLPKEIFVSAEPIEKPKLILPKVSFMRFVTLQPKGTKGELLWL
jgi:hypothetical protein